MAYKHILVSDLHTPKSDDLHESEELQGWPHVVDGVPVRRELAELCHTLRKIHSGYRFHAEKRNHKQVNVQFSDGVVKRLYSDLTVYIEGADYTVGRIGYGKTFGMEPVEDPVYMIHSRRINNEKYAAHRDQYHMSFAKDLKKATKTALGKLTPYSPKEMALISFPLFQSDLKDVYWEAHTKLNKIVDPLAERSVLLTEVRNLIAMGVSFSTSEFIEAAKQVVQADKDWEAMKVHKFDAYYIYVRLVGGQQWVDVVETPDARVRKDYEIEKLSVTSMPIDDLPDDVKGKLAVLSIATNDQFMEGVGRRVSDKSFWVER